MIQVVHPESRSRIRIWDPDFLPIPDPGVKKTPDPGSTTLISCGSGDPHSASGISLCMGDFVKMINKINGCKNHCSGSVTSWNGSRSADPNHGLMDPDPVLVASDLQDAKKIHLIF
jgi:hypothetical protein